MEPSTKSCESLVAISSNDNPVSLFSNALVAVAASPSGASAVNLRNSLGNSFTSAALADDGLMLIICKPSSAAPC